MRKFIYKLLIQPAVVFITFQSFIIAASAQSEPVAPAPGELVISEVMFNPFCPVDNDAEWFELTNVSGKVLDVNGLYFQDGAFPGASGDKYFQVLPSVATLPPMLPGQRFVFCRSNNPAINGGLPQVDYWFAAVDDNVPPDHSQIGHSQMNMGNSNIDGMHITIGQPAFLGGTVIDSFSYNPFASPLAGSDGISVERKDLYLPFTVTGTVNSTNSSQAQVTALFGTCFPKERGTPGAKNSNDTTAVWKLYREFTDSLTENTGAIVVDTPLSVSAGLVTFKNSGGYPGALYTFGYADAPSEVPLTFIIPGNPGSILLDLNSAAFLIDDLDANYYFDANGDAVLPISYIADPMTVGRFFYFQWLGVGAGYPNVLQASKGIRMVMEF